MEANWLNALEGVGVHLLVAVRASPDQVLRSLLGEEGSDFLEEPFLSL